MSDSFNPEAVPDALKAAMILYQQANPTTSTGQPTVVQGIMNALNPQQQQQQQAQMGAQPQNMGDVVGQAENAVPTQQQNAQMAAAQQMQGAAQGMPPGMEQQQMQQPDAGIVGLPASNTQQFKEGGVIGFAVGGGVPTLSQEEKDMLLLKQGGRNALETIKSLAAAGYDMSTLLPRGVMGAAETAITRPLRAVGVPIPYLPESAYGGDRSSMTPMMDMLRRRREKEETPDHAMMSQALSESGLTAKKEEKLPEIPQGDDSMARLLAAIGGGGGGGGGRPASQGDLIEQAKRARDALVPRTDTSPLDRLEAMINRHYAERPDIEGDTLRGIEEARAEDLRGQGMREFLERAASMGQYGSSGLLRAASGIASRRKESDALFRKDVMLQRLAQQAIKDGKMDVYKDILGKRQELNAKQAELDGRTGMDAFGNVAQMDINRLNREAAAANAGISARSRLAAAMLRGKTQTGMGLTDLKTLKEMVKSDFRDLNGEVARQYLPAQLILDLSSGDKKATDPDVAPLIIRGMNKYEQRLLGQTKFGAGQQVTSYSDYARNASEEDADDTTEE